MSTFKESKLSAEETQKITKEEGKKGLLKRIIGSDGYSFLLHVQMKPDSQVEEFANELTIQFGKFCFRSIFGSLQTEKEKYMTICFRRSTSLEWIESILLYIDRSDETIQFSWMHRSEMPGWNDVGETEEGKTTNE